MEGIEWHGLRTPNGTIIPDELFDVLMPILSDSEFKVLMYIARRTFGFKKATDNISIKQMADGIVTHEGKVLDRGTGLGKASVVRGVKTLVEKGIIVAVRNKGHDGGDKPSTYRIRFFGEGVSQIETRGVSQNESPGVPQIETGGVSERDTQQTVKQTTEGFDNSNDLPRGRIVDNLGITGYLDNLIVDISREFGDTGHLASNCKQARNIFADLDVAEEDFVERYVYTARQKTKRQTKVRQKMPYFFRVLREMCGMTMAEEA